MSALPQFDPWLTGDDGPAAALDAGLARAAEVVGRPGAR